MTKAVELAQVASTGVSEAFKNRIINGAMVIDQRNAGASVTANGLIYTLDRWFSYADVGSKFTTQQNAGSVTPPVGFTNYLGATSLSAYTVGSGETFLIDQRIEGFNTADLNWGTANAKTVTLSFWVRSSLTGTFAGSLRNASQNRSYPFTYTISSANTWTTASVTIAGDTSGTWNTTNGVGIELAFSLGTGSTFNGTAGAWAAGNFLSVTGATSVVGTNGATFYITGVQLEVGSTATSFDYRQYGTELSLCQRYFEVIRNGTGGDTFYGATIPSSGYRAYWFFKNEKRAQATVTLNSASTWGGSAPNFYPSASGCSFYNASGTYSTNGANGSIGLQADAEL